MQLGWLEIVVILLSVCVGVGLTLLYQRYRKPRSQQELEAEHKRLQEEVMEHFVTTANLVNDMTDSYKAVFDHLNEGATKLVDNTELRERLPNEERKVITLSRIGQSESGIAGESNHTSADLNEQENGGAELPEEDLEPPRF